MVRVLLILALALPVSAYSWDRERIAMEAGFLAVHTVDYLQTRDIAKRCTDGFIREMNLILGACPTLTQVNAYFLTTAIIHAAFVHYLPKKDARIFQGISIFFVASITVNNAQGGIRATF